MGIRKLSRSTREYPEIGSTNAEMHRLLGREPLEEGTVIRADFQTAGKGYRDSIWSSERGKNLLFSILLRPGTVPVESAFNLSRITSLSLIEVLDKHSVRSTIKWPNDILAGSRKISGILIENCITGNRIVHSVIGIGLNVNQERFDAGIPAPTSMFLEKGCQFDRNMLLAEFRSALEGWYQSLLSGHSGQILDSYNARLHRLGTPSRFSDGRHIFTASIRGVMPGGELELRLEGGVLRRYAFKEIEYLD